VGVAFEGRGLPTEEVPTAGLALESLGLPTEGVPVAGLAVESLGLLDSSCTGIISSVSSDTRVNFRRRCR